MTVAIFKKIHRKNQREKKSKKTMRGVWTPPPLPHLTVCTPLFGVRMRRRYSWFISDSTDDSRRPFGGRQISRRRYEILSRPCAGQSIISQNRAPRNVCPDPSEDRRLSPRSVRYDDRCSHYSAKHSLTGSRKTHDRETRPIHTIYTLFSFTWKTRS